MHTRLDVAVVAVMGVKFCQEIICCEYGLILAFGNVQIQLYDLWNLSDYEYGTFLGMAN
jgi:hypothetical protein